MEGKDRIKKYSGGEIPELLFLNVVRPSADRIMQGQHDFICLESFTEYNLNGKVWL
jgi:hypothetical protein